MSSLWGRLAVARERKVKGSQEEGSTSLRCRDLDLGLGFDLYKLFNLIN